MTATIINGMKIAHDISTVLKQRVLFLRKKGITPKLGVVLVGADQRSILYVNKKRQLAKKLGVKFQVFHFSPTLSTAELKSKIKIIQQDQTISGLIVQLPLPAHIDRQIILDAVDPKRDADCLNSKNSAKLSRRPALIPPTPLAILIILNELNINLKNKKIVLFGAGILVGKPLAVLLKSLGAKIKIITNQTKNAKSVSVWGDVIITAVGKKDLVRGNMVKPGAIVIDAGVCYDGGQMFGDANAKEVMKKASYFTPTPGGVGPITVALLLNNTVKCAEMRANLKR